MLIQKNIPRTNYTFLPQLDLPSTILVMNQFPEFIMNCIKLHQTQLDEYRVMEKACLGHPDPPVELQFKYLTLKRGIAYETSWLQWCDDVLLFLKEYDAKQGTLS